MSNDTTVSASTDLQSLKRYDIDCDGLPFYDHHGAWVAYEDIAALTRAPLPNQENEKLRELLHEADKLLWIASGAMLKMGLRDKGSDCGLPHEVREFALEFSNEGRDGPGALQVRGTGRYRTWLIAVRNLDRAAMSGTEESIAASLAGKVEQQ